jgi:nitrite reductase/ring-hydroxylating ferredoxin subunit
VICQSEALVDRGEGVRFEVVQGGARHPAFAIRFDGRVHAYRNRCAHVAVELDWQAGRFFDADGIVLICSTHGALYDPESGECRGGPCRGAGLEPVPVEEIDGLVMLSMRD